ncbi:cyclin-dependent kinase inhibitor 5-like [Mangifera indica]|uniref:cyclin-dependent kinase inhibitor 5-like n=1 Tax=Mangifera indica TaxID=29780 RepID=UPI001CFA4D33|nr:cyclin-dependent kinase inhibitor 5-like [Mangifera indica]
MGRYMRKAKTAGEVAIMDLTLGVRTRARTLALQKSSIPPSRSPSTASSAAAGGSYLQLRSRRLEKPPIVVNDSAKRAKQGPAKEKENCASESQNQNPNSSNSRARVRVSQADPGSNGSGQKNESNSNGNENVGVGVEEETNQDLGVEASFGENALEIEGRERGTRESTPCSMIRQPDSIRTPGSTTRPSTTRPTSSIEGRGTRNSTQRQIPTAHEMNQFFLGAEEEQQRQFVEKYNFDPVNDKPLPGRFEWEKVDP